MLLVLRVVALVFAGMCLMPCVCSADAIHGEAVVPEASACILAPVGIAVILAAERHRRRVASVKRRIGLFYLTTKRISDLVLASIILLITLPLSAAVALAVRLDSPGPILFRRRVIGKDGKEFDMFKFRSMVEGAEAILEENEDLKKEYYVSAKLKSDPRVTRLGQLLRKTSMDELPQLINIVIGNMTFVGPRPIAQDEIDLYGPAIEQFKTVTPGITGIWQTCGRSETSYASRVEMDLQYIEKRSILLDLWIIMSTIPAVILKRGAY